MFLLQVIRVLRFGASSIKWVLKFLRGLKCFIKVKIFHGVYVLDEFECPTCLEEYTDENPNITSKYNHHFHLGCIYEWMERSTTCPICSEAHFNLGRKMYQST